MATTNTTGKERTNFSCMIGIHNPRDSSRNSKRCYTVTVNQLKVSLHLSYLMNGCENLMKSSLTKTENLCYRLINVPHLIKKNFKLFFFSFFPRTQLLTFSLWNKALYILSKSSSEASLSKNNQTLHKK